MYFMERGFKQFLIKTGVFVIAFLAIQIITMQISANTKIPNNLTPFYLTDIAKVGLFALVLFFVAYREKLFKLKESKFEFKSLVAFGILEIIALIGYFKYKVFVINNLETVNANLVLYQILTYLILFLTLVFLGLAVFGWKFSGNFIKKFKKEILLFLVLFLGVYILSEYVQKSWHYFSYVVAHSVNWLLNLVSNSTLMFKENLPIIGLDNFVVAIDSPCSGIESMFLFVILYLFIASFDWKLFNKKKLIAMFIPGVISVFILNIIRIFALILVGAYVSPKFALGLFHTNASWILFIIYFILFWGLLYKWMLRKHL